MTSAAPTSELKSRNSTRLALDFIAHAKTDSTTDYAQLVALFQAVARIELEKAAS